MRVDVRPLIGSGSGRPAGQQRQRRRDLQRASCARRRSAEPVVEAGDVRARRRPRAATAAAGRRRSAAPRGDTTRSASAPGWRRSATCRRAALALVDHDDLEPVHQLRVVQRGGEPAELLGEDSGGAVGPTTSRSSHAPRSKPRNRAERRLACRRIGRRHLGRRRGWRPRSRSAPRCGGVAVRSSRVERPRRHERASELAAVARPDDVASESRVPRRRVAALRQSDPYAHPPTNARTATDDVAPELQRHADAGVRPRAPPPRRRSPPHLRRGFTRCRPR